MLRLFAVLGVLLIATLGVLFVTGVISQAAFTDLLVKGGGALVIMAIAGAAIAFISSKKQDEQE